jgi:STE24 endopeptidase
VQLARTNISDPEPPQLLHDLFGTHPTTVERIGSALAYAQDN